MKLRLITPLILLLSNYGIGQCIENSTFDVNTTGLTSQQQQTAFQNGFVDDWQKGHGTPSIHGYPTSPYTWIYNNGSVYSAESIYTDYNFEAGKMYSISFKVRTADGNPALQVYKDTIAANSSVNLYAVDESNILLNSTVAYSPEPSTPNAEEIWSYPTNSSESFADLYGANWTQFEVCYTAATNHDALLIFPRLSTTYGLGQAELMIDDITINKADPFFTYEVNCTSLTVTGVDQPCGIDPYHQFNLFQWDASGNHVLLETIAWWQNATNPYTYNSGPYTFSTQLVQGVTYFVQRGVYDGCNSWDSHAEYGIQVNGPITFDTDFDWEVNCNNLLQPILTVTGRSQASTANPNPYHQYNLWKVVAGGNDILVETIAWWEFGTNPYNYSVGPYSFDLPLVLGENYYIQRGIWDDCNNWQSTQKYGIIAADCENMKKAGSRSAESNLNLDNKEVKTEVSVFPNPATDIIEITSNKKVVSVILFDILGSEVAKFNSTKINLSNISPNVYFLRIEHADSSISIKKIVKE